MSWIFNSSACIRSTGVSWIFNASDLVRDTFGEATCLEEATHHFKENGFSPPVCAQYSRDLALQCKVHEFWCIPFDRVDDFFLDLWFDTPAADRPKTSYVELEPFRDTESWLIDWDSSLVDICRKDQVRMFEYALANTANTSYAHCKALQGCAESMRQLCAPLVLDQVTFIYPKMLNLVYIFRYRYPMTTQWLRETYNCGPLAAMLIDRYNWIRSDIYLTFASNGNLATIKYLDARGYQPNQDEQAVIVNYFAITNLHIIKYFDTVWNCRNFSCTTFSIVKYLTSRGHTIPIDCRYMKTQVVRYLHEECGYPIPDLHNQIIQNYTMLVYLCSINHKIDTYEQWMYCTGHNTVMVSYLIRQQVPVPNIKAGYQILRRAIHVHNLPVTKYMCQVLSDYIRHPEHQPEPQLVIGYPQYNSVRLIALNANLAWEYVNKNALPEIHENL